VIRDCWLRDFLYYQFRPSVSAVSPSPGVLPTICALLLFPPLTVVLGDFLRAASVITQKNTTLRLPAAISPIAFRQFKCQKIVRVRYILALVGHLRGDPNRELLWHPSSSGCCPASDRFSNPPLVCVFNNEALALFLWRLSPRARPKPSADLRNRSGVFILVIVQVCLTMFLGVFGIFTSGFKAPDFFFPFSMFRICRPVAAFRDTRTSAQSAPFFTIRAVITALPPE